MQIACVFGAKLALYWDSYSNLLLGLWNNLKWKQIENVIELQIVSANISIDLRPFNGLSNVGLFNVLYVNASVGSILGDQCMGAVLLQRHIKMGHLHCPNVSTIGNLLYRDERNAKKNENKIQKMVLFKTRKEGE